MWQNEAAGTGGREKSGRLFLFGQGKIPGACKALRQPERSFCLLTMRDRRTEIFSDPDGLGAVSLTGSGRQDTDMKFSHGFFCQC
jgi:hypothetical protein